MTRLSPASLSASRFLCKQETIRRKCNILDALKCGELRDKKFESVPKQRLTACESYLVHAELDKNSGQADDLLEGEHLLLRNEVITLPKDVRRHAERATEVAAVRHGDTEIIGEGV